MKISNRLSIEFLPDEDFLFTAYPWFRWLYWVDHKELYLVWIKITAKGKYNLEKIYGPDPEIEEYDFPKTDSFHRKKIMNKKEK